MNAGNPPDGDHSPSPDAVVPDAGWLARNGPYLVLFAALLAFLRYKGFDLLDLWNIVKAGLGLGLVIFIHELGHFLVAKWCDVHVETFSIGFGPPLPGCCFRRGETTYMIALLPLGGYVKMVGEGAENDDSDTDPRSFKNKSVYQRMAIISAGVVMNVLLAFACFVFVFMTHGAKERPGVIDRVESGSPAWKVGARTGDVIHQIGAATGDPTFNKLMPAIMLSKEGERLPFAFSPPGVPPQDWTRTEVTPRKGADDERPMLGFVAPDQLELPPTHLQRYRDVPVEYHSAAAAAEPAFEFGDRIIGTTDPDHPDRVTELPKDLRDPTGRQYDYFAFGRRMKRLQGRPVVLRVRRGPEGEGASPQTVDVRVPAAFRYTLGLRMRMGKVQAVRNHSPAAQAGVQEGDIIEAVEVAGPGGKTIHYVSARSKAAPPAHVEEKDLDPERLPLELEQWAAAAAGDRTVALTVLRTNPPPKEGNAADHKELRPVRLRLKWDDSWQFDKEVSMSDSAPLAVPELGLAYGIETTVEGVQPDSPAAKQDIKPGDVIKEVRSYAFDKKAGAAEARDWKPVKPNQWANLHFALEYLEEPRLDLRVERDKAVREVNLELVRDETWPQVDRGLLLTADTRLQKADGFVQAIGMGINRTVDFIRQIYGNLRGFATGRLSLKLMAGPITIGTAAYNIAGMNIFEFITFLGMISVNLAVINFLPIPVLDGGHMVFLIYEKLRGQPASEGVRVAALYLGLALLVSLMIFVFYLDLKRLVGT
jgi:regulator of sigma E protease